MFSITINGSKEADKISLITHCGAAVGGRLQFISVPLYIRVIGSSSRMGNI